MSGVFCWFIHATIRSSSLGEVCGIENEPIDSFLHLVDYRQLIRLQTLYEVRYCTQSSRTKMHQGCLSVLAQ